MDISQVLNAYRTFDPVGWISVYRSMPVWLGILSVLVGVLLLVAGGGRTFRFVAGPAGAVVGFLWVPVVAQQLGLPLSGNVVGAVAGAVIGVCSFVLPPTAVFFALGLPAGFAIGNMAGPTDWFVGFLPGFLALGTAAAVFARHIGAVFSSVLGAWLGIIGALAALHSVGGIVAAVAREPWGVMLAAALFALAGSVYQLFVRPSPEEAERLKIERARIKRRIEEKRALEERWAPKNAAGDE